MSEITNQRVTGTPPITTEASLHKCISQLQAELQAASNRVRELERHSESMVDQLQASGLDFEHMKKQRDELRSQLEQANGRLKWLLDQLSPSMFADHGIHALRKVNAAMRGSFYDQCGAALGVIDAARPTPENGEVSNAQEHAVQPTPDIQRERELSDQLAGALRIAKRHVGHSNTFEELRLQCEAALAQHAALRALP